LPREQALRLHDGDNVLVALADLPSGAQVRDSGRVLALVAPVPAKHKFAVRAIPQGGTIVMYGVTVG
jgi:altronate hydrolase